MIRSGDYVGCEGVRVIRNGDYGVGSEGVGAIRDKDYVGREEVRVKNRKTGGSGWKF